MKPSDDAELRGYLRVIEVDDSFIEGLQKLAGDRRAWFFEAAMGAGGGLPEDERGHAAYIFGRLASAAEIGQLDALARARSALVRHNVIEAIGQRTGPEAKDLLFKLLDDQTRPPTERLQVLRALRMAIDDRTLERLRQIDLDRQPDELRHGISLLLARPPRGRA